MVKMVHASIGGDLEKICEDKSLLVAFWKKFRSMEHVRLEHLKIFRAKVVTIVVVELIKDDC